MSAATANDLNDFIERVRIAENKREFQEFIDSLSGASWRNFATAHYSTSISEEISHEDAMRDVSGAIIELSKELITNPELDKIAPIDAKKDTDTALPLVPVFNSGNVIPQMLDVLEKMSSDNLLYKARYKGELWFTWVDNGLPVKAVPYGMAKKYGYIPPEISGQYWIENRAFTLGELEIISAANAEIDSIKLENHRKLLQASMWKKERQALLEMTAMLDEHPEGYEGPCLCELCCSCA